MTLKHLMLVVVHAFHGHTAAQAYECSTLEASSRQEEGHSDVGKLLAEAVAAAHAVAITMDEAEATAQGGVLGCFEMWCFGLLCAS